MSNATKSALKRLESAKDLSRFMAEYYYALDEADRSTKQKIAWCTSVGPAELLRGMGYQIYFPETHSAMLGATRMATDLIPTATAMGYSPEICSYLTADIGAFVKGITPLAKALESITQVSKPDILVYNTNQCRDVQDWFTWYADKFKVPVIGIQSHRSVGAITESHITSIAAQIENLVEPLEQVAGQKLDMDAFKHAVALSRQCSDLWEKCLATALARPAPLTSLTARPSWDRRWWAAERKRLWMSTVCCWRNWNRAWPTTWGPWLTKSDTVCIGMVCRYGDAWGCIPRCLPNSAPM
ncbi:hypothetical protein DSCO28_17050 [Desulfosarcina ovata subsp. sediminis]|uniref:2-hydroxyglutaryl-CoA dehydratase n=1 Tax=Desulfosarcina ovata subsp. sediminis TaxID=885957 RepID=A0A5K7ZND3_9BACT|nr:hypothetical protein DSCO28_17050 [Desulfosarcina ovata subsp. sediminis]